MTILRKKIFWIMLFVVALGTVLRLAFIDKPDGLWNDEYVSWFIASIPYGKDFWNAVFAQCHMPFYYFYLKFFIHFFGNSDLMLRLTSVIPGILSIISMYFVGKEFKDEKLGVLCASVTSFSSFLIYFSQEVRFYGLLFLFSSLLLLFTLKLIKEQKLSNVLWFTLFNFMIIFTHTIGFVFVLINLLFLTIYIRLAELDLGDKCQSRLGLLTQQHKTMALWSSLFLLILICFPLIFKILTSNSISQFWGHFTFSKLGFLMTDYFSPVLTNIVNAPDNFFYDFSIKFIIFALIPVLIAFAGILKAVIKEKGKRKKEKDHIIPFTICHLLFVICLIYVLVLIFAAILGKMVFITKYSIEIYPTLILLTSFGLLEFSKKIRYPLIFLFCFLNLFYILTSPVSAPKLRRSEGHKIVADLLKNADLKDGDFILLNYYPKNRFEKYFNFDKYNVFSINKGNFLDYEGEKFTPEFEKNVLNKLKPNQKMAIVVLNSVSMHSPMQLQELRKNEKMYKKVPLFFVVFSELKNKEFEVAMKKLQLSRVEQKGSWSVVTFIKR